MKKIHTDNAPAAVGPYSQAIATETTVYTSGQLGLDPKTGKLAGETVAEQAEQAMKNIEAVLTAAGSSMDKVVKTTCLLADIADFAEFNKVYAQHFRGCPARSCFAVRDIPLGALCEIETIAEL